MTKRKYGLLSSSALYGLGGVAQRLIGLLLLPVFTRYLTPADYGVVGLLTALPALLVPIFSVGLSASISVCYFSDKYSKITGSVIQTSRYIIYLSTTVMVILTIFGLDVIAEIAAGSLNYRVHTLVAITTVVFSLLSLPLQLELQFSGRPLKFVIISFLGALAASGSSILTIIFFELGALGLLLGGLIGQILVWSLLSLRNKRDAQNFVNNEIAKELLRHGLPLLPSFAFLFILQNGVRWLLESFHGVSEVGLYSVGTNFGSILTMITSGFVTAWMPWAMQFSENWVERRYLVAERLMQYFIIVGYIVLIFFCMAQPLLWLTTSGDYFGAWVVVGMSAVTSFMMSIFSLLLPPIYMAGKVSLVLVSQSIAALTAICCAYILVDFGSLGASASVMLGSISLVIAQLIVNATLTGRLPIPLNIKNLFYISLVLSSSYSITFWFRLEFIESFILQVAAIILSAGYLLFKFFPNKTEILRRIKREND